MRILVTVDPEIPVPPTLYGGIERIAASLITELRSRGHQVGLVAHPESTTSVDRFFPWPVTSSGAQSAGVNALALYRATREFEPEVVHSFSRLLYLLPLLTSSIPRVMSFQRPPTRRTVALSSWLAGARLRFTGCSEHICRLGRAAGGEWTAIPNFVDVKKFGFQPTVAENAPLVFLSRVERIKGAHTAIAIARATGRKLLIAGNHATDGSEGEYWRCEIEPHLGPNVEYVGPVDDDRKIALLQSAAAMLVPIAWDEPFGIVFAEALACGTPVISCPRGALPEIVRDGMDGFLASGVEELADRVARISSIDRRQCRMRAESCFSTTVVTSQYEHLYVDTLRQRARASQLETDRVS
jgi:glycosyltransferase involved in cell wall biosynthesis